MILDEFMKEFQKRNQNLIVFNAVMHLDEVTPHLHIDLIPYCTAQERGFKYKGKYETSLKTDGLYRAF